MVKILAFKLKYFTSTGQYGGTRTPMSKLPKFVVGQIDPRTEK